MRGDRRFGTLPGLAAAAAEQFGDAVAVEDTGRRTSFRELYALSLRVAGGLRAEGVVRGDRIAIWAPNLWEWVVAALGVLALGAILVPINTRYKGAEARYLVDRSGARWLFTVRGFLGLDLPAMLDRPDLRTLAFRGAGDDGFDAWLDRAPTLDRVEVAPDDISDILFTSGTTGRPKGVPTTHAQTLRTYWDWSEVVGLREGDRYLVVAPFFHCFGYKAGWVAGLMRGATILPQATFDPAEVLDRIGRDRVTVLPGPPALYQTLLQRDRAGHDLSSLRLAVTGASTIPVQLVRDMREVLGFETVITGYGLTESSGVATMCRYDDDVETIATTSGRPIPGCEVRVVDSAGLELPAGSPGQVLVRGHQVMGGYLDDPEGTASSIVDGWLHTGDIGILDARGYLRITDRLKDMFIVGGFNAYPAEIEQTLLEHPAVGEAAVVGIPEPRLGEVGVAFVTRRAGTDVDGEQLIGWCRERLANFKVPRRITFLDALPRNASAKVVKDVLRDLAQRST